MLSCLMYCSGFMCTSRCIRSMCRAMCIFCLARYTQYGHWNCGSLPHSHFWWLRRDDLSLYERPQSGQGKQGSPGEGGTECAALRLATSGIASRADHWSHDRPPILVKDTSSGPTPPEIAMGFIKSCNARRHGTNTQHIRHSREVNDIYKRIHTSYIHSKYIEIVHKLKIKK